MKDFERVERKIYALVWQVGESQLVYVDHALLRYYELNVSKHMDGKMKETRKAVQKHGKPELVFLEDNTCSPLEAEYTQIVHLKILLDKNNDMKPIRYDDVSMKALNLPSNLIKVYEKRVNTEK